MTMATKRTKTKKVSPKRKAASRKRADRPASDAAELQRLIQDIMQAKQRGDDPAREKAVVALIDFRERPVSAELRQAAAEARAVADNQVMMDSLRLLGEIAARLSAAAPTLGTATAIATSGGKNLLFPKLAATADNMLQAVLELKQATDNVKAQLEDAKELSDLPKLLNSVRDSLEKLKARAQSLQS
jgi:hypothetical protein